MVKQGWSFPNSTKLAIESYLMQKVQPVLKVLTCTQSLIMFSLLFCLLPKVSPPCIVSLNGQKYKFSDISLQRVYWIYRKFREMLPWFILRHLSKSSFSTNYCSIKFYFQRNNMTVWFHLYDIVLLIDYITKVCWR